MNYQIQGLSIHAEAGTAEPALVFLHYWGGTSRTWRKVTAELEVQFKTLAYDARGRGKSDMTLAGYKLGELADETLGWSSAGNQTICPSLDIRWEAGSRSLPHRGGRGGFQASF